MKVKDAMHKGVYWVGRDTPVTDLAKLMRKHDIGAHFPLASDTLSQIYGELQRARGHSSFVRCERLPPCDFLVPRPGFVVEFDESQHFTPLRRLILGYYADSSQHFGFDLETWMRLCDEIQARDAHPPFRDEQRAWFDTLRDFAPYFLNLMPTVRLRASEIEWCKLDPECTAHIETFRQMVGEWTNFWQLEFRVPAKPKLARIAVDGSWPGNAVVARKLLSEVCDDWPHGLHVKCFIDTRSFFTVPLAGEHSAST